MRPLLFALALTVSVCGCATQRIEQARQEFYSGRPDQAAQTLKEVPSEDTDYVLFLMERGTIYQTLAQYTNSANDYIAASDRLDALDTYSLSRGASSMVVNDKVQYFTGMPFERILLHSFTALDHLAIGNREWAAVEARRIAFYLRPDFIGGYPTDAFSRYLAGFCFELIGDYGNAALFYRQANSLNKTVYVDPKTGIPRQNIGSNKVLQAGDLIKKNSAPVSGETEPEPEKPVTSEAKNWPTELVCFPLLGRSASGDDVFWRNTGGSRAPYAEFYAGDQYLGRSYNLADVTKLAISSAEKEAVRKAVKTAVRIGMKEGIAETLDQTVDPALGNAARLILIGLLERPDTRRWETLPRWLQVARFRCPPNLQEYTVIIRNSQANAGRRYVIKGPLVKQDRLFISFFRDEPTSPLVGTVN